MADGADPLASRVSVLSADAKALYLRAVKAGGRLPRLDDERAAAELESFGLFVPDLDQAGMLVAVDPRRLSESLTAGLQKQALQLLSRSVALPGSLQELVDAYEESGSTSESGGSIEYVHGKVEINQRIAAMIEESSEEVLAAQPGGGGRAIQMKAAVDLDIKLLQRGVARRTIYQPSARYAAPTRQYVEVMTKAGGQVRTLGEPFTRLIIIDRGLAIIPVIGDTERAAFIRDEAVIGFFWDVFEALWERAIPFLGDGQMAPEVVSDMRRNIVRLMMEGVGHRIIARNLGLSERTLARHIAEMREEYQVDTLFQLGWRMARQDLGPVIDHDGESEPAG